MLATEHDLVFINRKRGEGRNAERDTETDGEDRDRQTDRDTMGPLPMNINDPSML